MGAWVYSGHICRPKAVSLWPRIILYNKHDPKTQCSKSGSPQSDPTLSLQQQAREKYIHTSKMTRKHLFYPETLCTHMPEPGELILCPGLLQPTPRSGIEGSYTCPSSKPNYMDASCPLLHTSLISRKVGCGPPISQDSKYTLLNISNSMG